MIKRRIVETLLCILLLLTLWFILGYSLLPNLLPSTNSAWGQLVFQALSGNLEPITSLSSNDLLHLISHASEFALLGVELSLLTRVLYRCSSALPLLCGLSVALADETIQLFATGQAGNVLDVWVDFTGVCLGYALVSLFAYLFRQFHALKADISTIENHTVSAKPKV